jgi:hypothetical protein
VIAKPGSGKVNSRVRIQIRGSEICYNQYFDSGSAMLRSLGSGSCSKKLNKITKNLILNFLNVLYFYLPRQGCEYGSVSGSGLDPNSIGSVDPNPDPDPGGQK